MSKPNPAETGGQPGKLADFLRPRLDKRLSEKTQEERMDALIPVIFGIAKELKFQPLETKFEIAPTDYIDTIAAYSMPGAPPDWRGGEDYWKLKKEREKGSVIYELVVNTLPPLAFLAENNPDIAQILVIAHVMGHTDFFAHNVAFKNTDRYMGQNIIARTERILYYEEQLGIPKVEEFVDAANAIAWNIDPDPKSPINNMTNEEYKAWGKKRFKELWETSHRRPRSAYDDLLELEDRGKEKPVAPNAPFPAFEERDIMQFIRKFAPDGFIDESVPEELKEWQADILDSTRKMMVHLWPQAETKIMNEGWASYAHTSILHKMIERDLIPKESDDAIESSRMHAGVVQGHPLHPNPYQLGLAIWEDIARKYAGDPRKDGKPDRDWMGNIIDVTKMSKEERERRYNPRHIMETHRDESFIREFLTPALVEDLKLYQYALRDGENSWEGKHWRITTRQAQEIINGMAEQHINNGLPVIVVAPGGGDYKGKKELYLLHKHEGKEGSDLFLKDAKAVLTHLYTLWKRPVHLETVVDGKRYLYTCQGNKVSGKEIKEEATS